MIANAIDRLFVYSSLVHFLRTNNFCYKNNFLIIFLFFLYRYFAIVHPLKSRMQQSKRRTCRILVAVWALAAFGSAPNFLSAPQAHDYVLYSDYGAISRRSCIPSFSRHQRVAYFTALFVAFYLIPLMLIAFTCFCIARSLLRTSVLRRQGSLLRQEVNRRKVSVLFIFVHFLTIVSLLETRWARWSWLSCWASPSLGRPTFSCPSLRSTRRETLCGTTIFTLPCCASTSLPSFIAPSTRSFTPACLLDFARALCAYCDSQFAVVGREVQEVVGVLTELADRRPLMIHLLAHVAVWSMVCCKWACAHDDGELTRLSFFPFFLLFCSKRVSTSG